MGSLLSLQYGQVILVNGYPVLTAVKYRNPNLVQPKTA